MIRECEFGFELLTLFISGSSDVIIELEVGENTYGSYTS